MNLSISKQRINDRRHAVISAYKDLKPKESVSVLVSKLAKRYKVTEVTIYNDLKPVTVKPDAAD